jgi:thiol-disulfide isomerase/thioredoxin
MLKQYNEVSKSEFKFSFYHTSEEIGKKAFPEIEEFPVVVLLKDFDEEDSYFRPVFSKQEFQEFLIKSERPLVNTEFSQAILDEIFGDKAPKKGIIMFRSAYSPDADKIDSTFRKVAEKTQKDENSYIVTDITQEGYQEKVAFFLSVTEKDLPSMQYLNRSEELLRYVYNGPIDENKMVEFIKNVEAGKVQRFLRSEPAPLPKENRGPVYKAVGTTFLNEVIKVNKDVLVMFYAPWDQKSKNFTETFKAMAKKLSVHKKLKLVSIDVTQNDVPGHPLVDLLSLKLFPAKDKKKFVPYTGELKEEDIVTFLKKKCSYTIEELE